MAYRLKRRESVADGVCRVAREQIDQALGELDDSELDVDHKIHQVRKRCKKLRGLVRLLRPALGKRYREENARYRDAARLLAGARDAQSMLVAFDRLVSHFDAEIRPDAFASLRQRLSDDIGAGSKDRPDLQKRLQEFEASFREGRKHLEGWSLSESGFDAISGGLQMTYCRGRDAMASAYTVSTPEAFHEWRTHLKYHGYHLRLLRPLWPSLLTTQRSAIDQLSEQLGDDHDLAVLRDAVGGGREVRDNESTIEAFLALLDRRRLELQSFARPVGARIYAEKPKALVDRFGAYWKAWRW